MMFLRNGQWVMFKPQVAMDGAFHSRDGRVVGIFCIGPYGSEHESFIAVVDPVGDNLFIEIDGLKFEAKASPNQEGLEPVTNRKDIPPKRIEHLPASWQPRA